MTRRTSTKPATPAAVERPPIATNGHPALDGEQVIQLARMVVEMERKGEVLNRLAQQIKALSPLRIAPVEGEVSFHQRLEALLQQARSAIRQLATAADSAAVASLLAQLAQWLGDVDWDLLEERVKRLAGKLREQDALLQHYKGAVDPYRDRFNRLRAALDRAARARAPVRNQAELLRRLESHLRQVDLTLVNQEQPFPILIQAIQALETETSTIDEELRAIGDITKQTERIIRNADLLLMQSPLDLMGRYQYEVGLRVAGESGAHGVSIQAPIKLVAQDRELMQHAIRQITNVVTGLARKDSEQSGQGAPISTATDVENAVTRAAVRAYIFGEETTSAEPVAPLASLVREMGDLMYRLFMPEAVQDYLRANTCSLTIATNDLELPWEFMYYDQTPTTPTDGDGGESQAGDQPNEDAENFLCLSRPIARRLMGRPLPTERPPRLDRPAKRQFLFIANPTGDLDGAEREVKAVVDELNRSWADQIETTVLSGKQVTGRRLNQLLRSDSYDVIHYSGHAFFDDNDPDYSGLLLHNREIFFADKVRRLLGGQPLVFLNACESARSANEDRSSGAGYNLQKPAQGLAASFVYGGALGCIGSLWPINDLRAARFAVEFYNQVLEGHMIGEAMRRARVRVKGNEPDEITWAAFVLYGDPTFRLVE